MTLKGHLVKSLVVPTHAERGFKTSYSQIVHLIERLIKLAGGKENVAGVGVCAPGPLNPKTGVIINPPNLPGWRNIQLARLLESHFHLPAKVENDANAAGLAEVLFGAAVGYRDVFYVTVSTGIGTGVIINKKIYHGKNGVARRRRARLHRLPQPVSLRLRHAGLHRGAGGRSCHGSPRARRPRAGAQPAKPAARTLGWRPPQDHARHDPGGRAQGRRLGQVHHRRHRVLSRRVAGRNDFAI